MTTSHPQDGINQSRRILIIGSDGMRPDTVTKEHMPLYASIINEGTLFKHYCAAYPSETRVSMSTLTTGVYPGKHGIVSNKPYIPGFRDGWLQTGDPTQLRALPSEIGEPTLLKPTLGDRLDAHGYNLSVASTGSGGSSVLWNIHHPEKVLNITTTYGTPEMEEVRRRCGAVPEDKLEREQWLINAFIETQLPDPRNKAMVLWIAEPDSACHKFGLGSAEHFQALKNADQYLQQVLDAVQQLDEELDILLMSDHGHSTVSAQGDLSQHVETACAELGISAEPFACSGRAVYAAAAVADTDLEQLTRWLKEKPWCGSVYVSHPHAEQMGALPIKVLFGEIEHQRAPLLVINPTWTSDKNQNGISGITHIPTAKGLSQHGNANPTEMNAFCLGWGPSFKKGYISEIPCGLVDIAPTICHLLGLHEESGFDGRVLREGLVDTPDIQAPAYDIMLEGKGSQRQPLQIANVENSRYILGCEEDSSG